MQKIAVKRLDSMPSIVVKRLDSMPSISSKEARQYA